MATDAANRGAVGGHGGAVDRDSAENRTEGREYLQSSVPKVAPPAQGQSPPSV